MASRPTAVARAELAALAVRAGRQVRCPPAPVAQWTERVASDHQVAGSNPAGRATTTTARHCRLDRRLQTHKREEPVLRQVGDGVLVHESEFIQSKSVVVQGRAGVLLIDPGIQGDEMAALANDLRELGQPVVAGFSTHPHWDHLLWHAKLGEAPRYGTARCAADIRDLLSNADWKARVAEMLPPDIAEEIPLDLLGIITGLPAKTARIPWDGPKVRIIEHQAHAPGHAALLIEERGVLVAGDMLSDILIPMLDLNAA